MAFNEDTYIKVSKYCSVISKYESDHMLRPCDAIFTFMYLHHTHRFAGRSLK